MKKVKEFVEHKKCVGSDGVERNILIYGELTEHDYVETINIVHAVRGGKSKLIVGTPNAMPITIELTEPTRTKEFRMGWAICQTEYDEFDLEEGIRLAKKRMDKPLTTQNGRYLTPDMVKAIMINEIDFINTHLRKFNVPL